jgi:hypothetical protein
MRSSATCVGREKRSRASGTHNSVRRLLVINLSLPYIVPPIKHYQSDLRLLCALVCVCACVRFEYLDNFKQPAQWQCNSEFRWKAQDRKNRFDRRIVAIVSIDRWRILGIAWKRIVLIQLTWYLLVHVAWTSVHSIRAAVSRCVALTDTGILVVCQHRSLRSTWIGVGSCVDRCHGVQTLSQILKVRWRLAGSIDRWRSATGACTIE